MTVEFDGSQSKRAVQEHTDAENESDNSNIKQSNKHEACICGTCRLADSVTRGAK
jgi:hypothetical protein